MTVHVKRHIAKTITYRLLGTLVTCVISFLFIGDIKISAMLGIAELVVKPITYFIHERVWYKWITFGLTNKKKE